jgi:hypothetical protein
MTSVTQILLGKAKIDFKLKMPTTCQMNKQVKDVFKKLNFKNKPMGIIEIMQIERFLKYYSINVIDGRKGNTKKDFFLYNGPLNKHFFLFCILRIILMLSGI